MISSTSFLILLSALSLAASQSSSCSAVVRLNSTVPGHGSFMYHDIIVENTGSCTITKVLASITLPPYSTVFEYKNVSSTTGELFGVSIPLASGSTQRGGTIVMNSARIPMVSVGSVECEATCQDSVAPAAPAIPTPSRATRDVSASIKVEVEYGANPRWIALSLLDEVDTNEMWLVDAKGSRHQMKRENWNTKTAYTLTSGQQPLELPFTLKLNSYYGETLVMKDIITSFSYNILDSQVAFETTPIMTPIEYTMNLVAHTSSNSQWIGLTPYGTRAVGVTSISIKAANTDLVPMTTESSGFFTLSSSLPLQLPITAVLYFNDGTSMTMDHAVEF